MDEHIKYRWQHAIVDAFLAEPEDIPIKISVAQRGILMRLKEPQSVDPEEKTALEDGLRALQVLVREVKSNAAKCQIQLPGGAELAARDTQPRTPSSAPGRARTIASRNSHYNRRAES